MIPEKAWSVPDDLLDQHRRAPLSSRTSSAGQQRERIRLVAVWAVHNLCIMDASQIPALAAEALAVAGIVATLAGIAVAAIYSLNDLRHHRCSHTVFRGLRVRIGRAILLGLELLVAADIFRTVAQPSLDGIVVLALIVLIRTFLSFALEIELEGRLPWQQPTDVAAPRSDARTSGT